MGTRAKQSKEQERERERDRTLVNYLRCAIVVRKRGRPEKINEKGISSSTIGQK